MDTYGISRRFRHAGTVFSLALLLLSSGPAAAAPDAADPPEWKGGCDIRFGGKSTLHDFSGTVGCRPFDVVATVAGGKVVIPRLEAFVLVGEMNTGNASRDRRMREMFESAAYPRIRAVLSGLDPAALRKTLTASPGAREPLEATLTIRNVSRKIRAEAGNLREEGGRITLDVEFPVSLKDFGLEPPSVLGIIRVKDTVTVAARVTLRDVQAK